MNDGYLDISEGGNVADSWPKMIHGAGAGGGIGNGFTGF